MMHPSTSGRIIRGKFSASSSVAAARRRFRCGVTIWSQTHYVRDVRRFGYRWRDQRDSLMWRGGRATTVRSSERALSRLRVRESIPVKWRNSIRHPARVSFASPCTVCVGPSLFWRRKKIVRVSAIGSVQTRSGRSSDTVGAAQKARRGESSIVVLQSKSNI